MDLKKSIFRYIIGAVFAVFCALSLFATLETAGVLEMFGWTRAGLIVGVAVYLSFTVAVFLAVRTISGEIRRHIRDRKKAELVCSIVFPVLALLGAVVSLVYYLLYHGPLMLRDDTFYRAALVLEGSSVPFSVHGASFLYTWLLHGMLLLFGNTPFAGVVLQIALFFICLLFLYIGMRSYVGGLPAAASTALFGLFPVSMEYIFSLTPDLFYLALYLLGFCMAGGIAGRLSKSDGGSPGIYVLSGFVGLYIGFLLYLDLHGVTVYFFLTALLFGDREKVRAAFRINGLALVGGIGGFFLCVAVIFLTGKMGFSLYLTEIVAFYAEEFGILTENILPVLGLPDRGLIAPGLLISLAFFGVPAFFLWRNHLGSPGILTLLSAYGLTFLGLSKLQHGEITVILGWCISAGFGIYGALRTRERKKMPEKADPGNSLENAAQKDETDRERVSKPKKDGNIKKEEMPATMDIRIKEEEKKALEAKLSEKREGKKEEQEKPAPGKPLHNPLPVPKKKSRPQADFDHPVREADMKFDVEVTDHDDFDL